MTKRLVDIDDDLLNRAQDVLGSRTIKETVNRALDETVRFELRRRLLNRLSRMEGLDLDDPKVMKGAWRVGGRTS
jgi:Arc/MetJ family transcription regulator